MEQDDVEIGRRRIVVGMAVAVASTALIAAAEYANARTAGLVAAAFILAGCATAVYGRVQMHRGGV